MYIVIYDDGSAAKLVSEKTLGIEDLNDIIQLHDDVLNILRVTGDTAWSVNNDLKVVPEVSLVDLNPQCLRVSPTC